MTDTNIPEVTVAYKSPISPPPIVPCGIDAQHFRARQVRDRAWIE
jgi:hypothetical protein